MSDPARTVQGMVIDCSDCRAPGKDDGSACADCVVTALLGPREGAAIELPHEHEQAVGALAASGLVPPLRLIRRAAG